MARPDPYSLHDHSYGLEKILHFLLAFGLAAGLGAFSFLIGGTLVNLMGWHAITGAVTHLQMGAVGGSILLGFATMRPVLDTIDRFNDLENGSSLADNARMLRNGLLFISAVAGIVGAACFGVTAGNTLGFAALSTFLGATSLVLTGSLIVSFTSQCHTPLRIYPSDFVPEISGLRDSQQISDNSSNQSEPGTTVQPGSQHQNRKSYRHGSR